MSSFQHEQIHFRWFLMRWVTAFASHVVICHHTWLFRRTQEMLNLFSICSVQFICYLLRQTLRHHECHSKAVMLSSPSSPQTTFIQQTVSDALPSLCLWGVKDFWKAGSRVMEMRSLGKEGVDVLGTHPVFPASLTNTL